jgi:hypothetical protein
MIGRRLISRLVQYETDRRTAEIALTIGAGGTSHQQRETQP